MPYAQPCERIKARISCYVTYIFFIVWIYRGLFCIIVMWEHHHPPTNSPQLDIGLSNFSPSRSIFGYSQPAPGSRSAQIVTPPGLRGVLHYVYLDAGLHSLNTFTPAAVVGSTAEMASPLPLQHANTVCYVSDFSSLPDHLVSNSISQRNPEHSSFHWVTLNLWTSRAVNVQVTAPYVLKIKPFI
jgi:hypothetical protein